MHETYDQYSYSFCHCVTYGWNYSENKEFPFLVGPPGNPLEDPTLRTTAVEFCEAERDVGGARQVLFQKAGRLETS